MESPLRNGKLLDPKIELLEAGPIVYSLHDIYSRRVVCLTLSLFLLLNYTCIRLMQKMYRPSFLYK